LDIVVGAVKYSDNEKSGPRGVKEVFTLSSRVQVSEDQIFDFE
jgi:hypothetical protein